MLDQNTDRMWYVIGAVIIGAAIIFILNGTMPELFASVGETFESKTKETTEMVDGIGPTKSRNLFDVIDLKTKVERGDVKYAAGTTCGYVYIGDPNTAYTVSTNILSREVNFEEYTYEYDLFVSTPVFDRPGSVRNGVALNEPRTIMTDESGELTIWFRIPSEYQDRTTYEQVLAGTVYVQLEKGNEATDFVSH